MIVFDQIESCIIDQSITLWCHGTLSSLKVNCPWDLTKETEPSFVVEGGLSLEDWRGSSGKQHLVNGMRLSCLNPLCISYALWWGSSVAPYQFKEQATDIAATTRHRNQPKTTWNRFASRETLQTCRPPFGCNGSMDGSMDHSHLSVSYFSLLHVKLQCLWCLCAKIAKVAKAKPPNLGLLSARLIIIKTTFQDWMCHTWNANRCETLALVPGFSCSTCQSPLISCSPFLFICTLLLQ